MSPSFAFLVTAGLSFTALVSGAPTSQAAGNSFSIDQVQNTKYARNGPLALAKIYKKYGATLPDDLAAAVNRIKKVNSRRETGSATNTPVESDSEWLTPVQIGSPAKTFNLDFDTGSSDLWVFSTETTGSSGHAEYDPDSSNSSKELTGATWSIQYGDGSSSSGNVFTDKVTVGGLTVAHQAVEAAETVSDTFSSETDLDGLLGLGFGSINTVTPNKQKTFFESATPQLSSPVFTADLKHNAAGKYNFGYIDSSAFTGKITYTPVDNSDGFWAFTSTGYAVGTGSLSDTSITGIADTGTTLLMLPNEIVEAYYSQVDGAQYNSYDGGYVFSCDADLPAFSFGIGDAKITIPAAYMNYASLDGTFSRRSSQGFKGAGRGFRRSHHDFGDDNSWGGENSGEDSGDNSGNDMGGIFGEIGQNSGSCFGGLQSSESIGINIFGDIALKAAFVVFDGGNTRLGWASKDLS